ncbi:MAG TPA: transglycosylase domain-containing protein [Propionibacteriaceae bacterium]|nr:transglycosylase domain-containing protein [Propionibacteriaceae bacterium]
MADPYWGPVEWEPQGTRARQKKEKTGQRWTRGVLITIGGLIILGMISAIAIVAYGYTTTKLPAANAEFNTATTFVYYKDGKSELGNFAIQNRTPLTFDKIPATMQQAAVAAENRTFWTDKGISIRGMIRAAWKIARGQDVQGGSTITQQYVKILYLNSERTMKRKFRELFLAYKINKEMSKQEILAGYLNTIYYGHGAYGVQAASQEYFNIDAKKLTVPQAAFLATVVNNPSLYDPRDEDDHGRIMSRYRYVLHAMAEMSYISPAQGAKYAQKLPKFPKTAQNDRYGGSKGFLLKMVERELEAAGFDPTQISGGGLKIITTFDKDAQQAAVDAAQKYTKQSASAVGRKSSKLHAALASVDVNSGAVIALYGGPDFVKNSRNWATTPRPTASTFKTYALAAGLDDGYSLLDTFNGNTFIPPGESKPVRNEFSYQYGSSVDLIKATAQSINTAYVDLTSQMDDGPRKIIKMAKAVGAPKGAGWDKTSRLPLGTAEVSPLAQASAYATFANDGVAVPNHVVREVRDRKGRVVYEANPEKKRVIGEDIAHDVTYALSNVVEEGTGRAVQTLDRPVAGKTGTKDRTNADGSSDIVSAWFVAYTKQISTAVMYVAGNDGNGDLDNYARPGDNTFFGGTYPALTWADYMRTATEGQAVKQFPGPAYVNRDEAPSPAQTMQETLQPTDEPSTEAPEPKSEPSHTWRLPPNWPPDWPTPPNPGATKPRKGPGGGDQQQDRWRRLLPSGNPTGGSG